MLWRKYYVNKEVVIRPPSQLDNCLISHDLTIQYFFLKWFVHEFVFFYARLDAVFFLFMRDTLPLNLI